MNKSKLKEDFINIKVKVCLILGLEFLYDPASNQREY